MTKPGSAMTKHRTAYLNARLLDPASDLDAPGDLLVEDGVITRLGPDIFAGDGPPDGADIVDCNGLCLAPGLFDMRVQVREPGHEHLESIHSAGLAAAAGGVTSMVCLPNTDPVIDDVSVVEFIARRAREEKLVKLFCYAALTKGMKGTELTEMGLLNETGVLGFTDAEKALSNPLVMRRALSYARTFGLLVIQHPEVVELTGDGVMTEGEIATRLGLAGAPAETEVIMVERDLRLVALTGGRYHVAHVSTAETVNAIRRAKRDGLDVTCDTAPHYFALNENAVGDYRTFAKVNPPLRRERDRQAIVDALAEGVIDAIASDHSPYDQDSKRLPFAQAAAGVVGLETLLPLTLELYHNRNMSLLDALRLVTINPARLLKQPTGRLAPGASADLVLFDPDKPLRIDADAFHGKSKNSPFDGRPVQGKVRRTVVEGRTIFVDVA
jgi:dihydroorotase